MTALFKGIKSLLEGMSNLAKVVTIAIVLGAGLGYVYLTGDTLPVDEQDSEALQIDQATGDIEARDGDVTGGVNSISF